MSAIAERLQQAAKLLGYRILTAYEALLQRVARSSPAITHAIDGDVEPGSFDRLCLFAHFDRHGRVDDYVVHYLQALCALGCEIVLVSTAASLDAADLKKIRKLCRRIIIRENVGYDFGSWKAGFAAVDDLNRFRNVILANDSVYGPLHDLPRIFERMDDGRYDFWGITDSHRYYRHLQSYFLVLGSAAVGHRAFAGFWRDLPYYRYKHSVIMKGEIGLTRALARAGLRYGALCRYQDLIARAAAQLPAGAERALPINATHYYWQSLIADFGSPFLKVEMLRDNPKNIPDLAGWRAVVARHSDYDCGLIDRHLARLEKR